MERRASHLFRYAALAAILSLAYSLTATQNAEKPVVGPEHGSLVIVGGGYPPSEIMDRFIQLAGGKNANFVVIPTAMDEKPNGREVEILRRNGAKHITVLHTYDRNVANEESFVAPLKTANGVWFNGGRQWRIADAYVGTRTQEELFAVLDRGGVIGGNSAGATIQGSFMVRGAPQSNEIMIAPDHVVGFGFLRDVAIDQHILARDRVTDMQQVIDAHPEILGIGIDEDTAIIVRGDHMEVMGKSRVAITDANHPPDKYGHHYFFLKSGDRFNLRTRAIEKK